MYTTKLSRKYVTKHVTCLEKGNKNVELCDKNYEKTCQSVKMKCVSFAWMGGRGVHCEYWLSWGWWPCWLSAPLHPPNPPLFVFLSQSDAYHCHSAGAHQHRYADSEIISSVCLSVAYISRYHTPVFIDHPRICFLILTFDFAHSPEVNLWMGQIQIKLKNKILTTLKAKQKLTLHNQTIHVRRT